MAFEIRYYNANNKDDIQIVTEFPYFLGHPVPLPTEILKFLPISFYFKGL